MPEQICTLPDWSELLRDVLPYAVILVLVWRGWTGRKADESTDVWTIRKTKGKE